MSTTLITAIITAIYLGAPVLIIVLFQRSNLVHKIGTVLLAYLVGVVLALVGAIPEVGVKPNLTLMGKIQEWIMNLAVPLAIPLMLFNSNFKLWTKSLPKTVAALCCGILAIIIAVVSGFFIFRNSGIENFSNVAAMMTSIYTGGTMNFYALGSALEVSQNTIVLTYTFEMLVTFPFILFLIGGGYKLFRKALPYPDEATSLTLSDNISADDFENYSGMLSGKNFPKMMLGFLLSVLFLAVGAGLSLLITGKLNELVIILTITTLAIAASFNKTIRNLPKTFELGMFFILIFSVVVASQFDIRELNMSAMSICWFILFVMIVAVTLHLLFSRFCRVSGDLFTVSNIALLCSPPFVPPVVGAMGNKKVLISGIVVGLIGYAVGTYLGIGISLLLGLL